MPMAIGERWYLLSCLVGQLDNTWPTCCYLRAILADHWWLSAKALLTWSGWSVGGMAVLRSSFTLNITFFIVFFSAFCINSDPVRSSWSVQPGDGPAWLGARANPGAALLQKLKTNWSYWWPTCPHFGKTRGPFEFRQIQGSTVPNIEQWKYDFETKFW